METTEIRHIPENYENGFHLLGMHFQTRFFLEALLFGGLGFILFFYGFAFLFTEISLKFGMSLAFAGVFVFFSLRGINDEPITRFFCQMIRFLIRRRIDYKKHE